jgi:gas vesicle protein
MSEKNNNAMVGALLLVAGGIIGAGVALLFAPQSGEKTRRELARYAKRTKHKVEDMVDEFAGNVSDMVESVGEKATDILDKGKDLAYDAKRGLVKAIEEGQEKLEKQRARLTKMIG